MGVYQKSPGIWYARYSIDGTLYRERAASRNEALAIYHDRKNGKLKPLRRSALKLRALAAAAMDRKRTEVSPRTFEEDCYRMERILASLGDAPVDERFRYKVDAFITGLKRQGLSGATANRFHALISSWFKWGAHVVDDSGKPLVTSNPMKEIERSAEPARRLRFLSDAEEPRLRKAIRAQCPEREAEVDLALHTGMRWGEQATLRWSGVDWKNKILSVRGKTGERKVLANRAAMRALKKLYRDRRRLTGWNKPVSEFVCPDTRSEATRSWPRWFQRALKTAGIPNFSWHTLRHTCASRLVMAGVPLPTVKELLGHADIKTTLRYIHLAPGAAREATERLVQK